MGYDRKYGKVTTEFGNIGEDEPVVVFRAKDKLLPQVIGYYIMACIKAGSPTRHIRILINTIQQVREWQGQHPFETQVPTSESSRDRLPE